jgi:hypothetical protein
MRETLRVDLEEGQVLAHIGEENLFETVEAAVIACLERMEAAGHRTGTPDVASGTGTPADPTPLPGPETGGAADPPSL